MKAAFVIRVIIIITLLFVATIGSSLSGAFMPIKGSLIPAIDLPMDSDLFLASNIRSQMDRDCLKTVANITFTVGTAIVLDIKVENLRNRAGFFLPMLIIMLFSVFYQISRINPDSAPVGLSYFHFA